MDLAGMEMGMVTGMAMDMDMAESMEAVIIWKRSWASGRFSKAFSEENKNLKKFLHVKRFYLQFLYVTEGKRSYGVPGSRLKVQSSKFKVQGSQPSTINLQPSTFLMAQFKNIQHEQSTWYAL